MFVNQAFLSGQCTTWLPLRGYLSDQEALLHVARLQGPEELHGLILALAGLQLLPGAQHALQKHQTHTKDYLHTWERGGEQRGATGGGGFYRQNPVPLQQASVTVTEEHVPDAQHGGPGQRPGEGTHKPLSHVEDGVDLVFLQMAEGQWGDASQHGEQDLSIQLYGFLKMDTDRIALTGNTKGFLFSIVGAATRYAYGYSTILSEAVKMWHVSGNIQLMCCFHLKQIK